MVWKISLYLLIGVSERVKNWDLRITFHRLSNGISQHKNENSSYAGVGRCFHGPSLKRLNMRWKQKNASCQIRIHLITQASSSLQGFLHSRIIYVFTYIHVGNKITSSLIHGMYFRSLYISYESTLSIQ